MDTEDRRSDRVMEEYEKQLKELWRLREQGQNVDEQAKRLFIDTEIELKEISERYARQIEGLQKEELLAHAKLFAFQAESGVPEPRWDELIRLCGSRDMGKVLVERVRLKYAAVGATVEEFFLVEMAIELHLTRKTLKGDDEASLEKWLLDVWRLGLYLVGACVNVLVTVAVLAYTPPSTVASINRSLGFSSFHLLPSLALGMMCCLVCPGVLPWKWLNQRYWTSYMTRVLIGISAAVPLVILYHWTH